MSASERRVVISGLGVVSPIGIGQAEFWDSLIRRRSGIRPVAAFPTAGLPFHFAGEVRNFDAKRYVKQRKTLRVMARDIQLAVSAAQMAVDDAGLEAARVPPERLGVE